MVDRSRTHYALCRFQIIHSQGVGQVLETDTVNEKPTIPGRIVLGLENGLMEILSQS